MRLTLTRLGREFGAGRVNLHLLPVRRVRGLEKVARASAPAERI